NATKRDIELQVSKNAKVTILNPTGLVEGDSNVIDDTDDTNTYNSGDTPQKKDGNAIANNDGVVIFDNVNLRKYHSTAMRVLVTSEDGKTKTEYRLTFKGTPTGNTTINSVTLHDASGDLKSTKNKDGDLIIHVPYAKTPTFANADTDVGTLLSNEYTKISVDSSDGATTFICSQATKGEPIQTASKLSEDNDTPSGPIFVRTNPAHTALVDWPSDAHCKMVLFLDTSYSSDADTTNVSKTAQRVWIYFDDPATTANITDITLTENNELVDAVGNKLPGKVNPNNKTIRIDVPYSFNRNDDNTTKAGTDLYLYDWAFNGVNASKEKAGTKSTNIDDIKYDFADLDNQETVHATAHTARTHLITLTESDITTVADASKYTPKPNNSTLASATNVITVWSEKDNDDASKNTIGTQYYTVYAVRQNASSESKLNNVTASAPVTVTKDTSVEKLNRFIITVPKNYNSTTGINDAKEFELNFSDRSKNSTVENGQTVWAAKDVDTVKFKVADGKLYFKDNEANLTDGRVIHFTIRAEDKTSTGAYEFLIREGEASRDATLKSVKVDEVSFTQDGDKFIVEDLSENENYDVTKLPVVIETNDPGATVTVDGKAYIPEVTTVDLSEGKTAEVVVTAA
ncbi:hypothetical protein, partial [Acutalibacter sp. 1XD8-36]|uniref:hypothetical protein n=1 Tax=Acutalibacter sp. 1XD8-36 TaxID=2320852 RepID=UPI00141360F5